MQALIIVMLSVDIMPSVAVVDALSLIHPTIKNACFVGWISAAQPPIPYQGGCHRLRVKG